jgi:glycosyltransferase involved in cell wall biosynthesis
VTPTVWQWSGFPEIHRPRITVLHEGIDTSLVRPNDEARFELADGRALTKADEVITYVARNLEPYRGFHVYMRAVAELCRRRPNAQFLIVGGDEVSYGGKLPDGQSYKQKALAEVKIDEARVHFLGRVPYGKFLSLLQVSSAHVYLTYPFILSWSLVESMAAGCLVVASRTAPVEEVITDRRNGRLVDFFDPVGIAETVTGVLDAPDHHAPLRKAARDTAVQHFDLNAVTLPRHMALIRDLL